MVNDNNKKSVSSQEKKRKYISIFISVVIATALWLYVINTENPIQTKIFYDIPIEYLNVNVLENKGLVISGERTETVSVELEGKRASLSSVKRDDILVTVDVSGYEEGESYVDVSVHVPSSVSVSKINPSQIRLSVEKKITEDREVNIVFKGNIPINKEAVYTDISTEIVAVSGAGSAVARVASLNAEVVSTELTEEEKEFTAELIPVDINGAEVEGVALSVDKVTMKACLFEVKTVRLNLITVGEMKETLEIASIDAPTTVTVAGPSDELSDITELNTAAVDLSGISSTIEVELKVDISGDVRMASRQEPIKALITVRKISSKQLTYSTDEINITGADDDAEYEFESQSAVITIRGTESALETAASSDFTLSADITGLDKGRHTVELEVKMSELAEEAELHVDTAEAVIIIKQAESDDN